MKYFDFFSEHETKTLFYKMPKCYLRTSPKEMLRIAVGALLYIPGSNEKISEIILLQKIKQATSITICLEDAIGDNNKEECIKNVKTCIGKIMNEIKSGNMDLHKLPLIFVRVKNTLMLNELKEFFIENSSIITGAILPKVTCESLEEDMQIIKDINKSIINNGMGENVFYAMPILEAEELLTCGNRIEHLNMYKNITDNYYDYILNIRVGATDLCGIYGIRRNKYTDIHKIDIINRCLGDIVQVFAFKNKYTVSSPVWEYFSKIDDTNFINGEYSSQELKGLIDETIINIQNGFVGKTAVHPTQLVPIQSVSCVSYEEYMDACTILDTDNTKTGVISSESKNKMNEVKPHEIWARKIISRAEVYGVYNNDKGFKDLIMLFNEKELEQWKQ